MLLSLRKAFLRVHLLFSLGALSMVSKELIEKAREIHGHICPFLVLGLRMSEVGFPEVIICE